MRLQKTKSKISLKVDIQIGWRRLYMVAGFLWLVANLAILFVFRGSGVEPIEFGGAVRDSWTIIKQLIPDFLYPVVFHARKPVGNLAAYETEQIGKLNRAQSNYTVEKEWSLTMDKVFSYDREQPWWRNPKIRRTMYLRPTSGLGNQLQTIATALTLARLEGFNVKIVFDTMGSYIKFDHDFSWSDMFQEPKLDFGDTFPGGRKQNSMSCRVHYAFHWHEIRDKWEKGPDGEERICVRACCLDMFPTKVWLPHTQWFYRSLLPADTPQKIVTAFKNEYDWDKYSWVGVHIRRTDRPMNTYRLLRKIPFSNFLDLSVRDYNTILPVSAVVDQMQLYLDILLSNRTEPQGVLKPVRFFLATDDKSVEPEILQAFSPGQVVKLTKTLSPRDARLKKSGMHLAVADLTLLASCRVLVGSAYSSFSKAATFMGNNLYTEPYYVTTWEKKV